MADPTLKLDPAINDELDANCEDYHAKKQWFAEVMLAYVMRNPARIEEAIDEWKQLGTVRTKRRRKVTPLPISPTEPVPQPEQSPPASLETKP